MANEDVNQANDPPPHTHTCASSSSGQYWWHLVRPRSERLVTMAMTCTLFSHTISQKLLNVDVSGPCAAINSFGPLKPRT